MTDQHPAVTFLLAAHERAEQQARKATPGPWYSNPHDWGDDDFAADVGTAEAGPGRWYGEGNVVGHGYEGGGVVEMPDAVFIAANDPAAVLRRVVGEREILAEHAESNGDCGTCVDSKWGYPVYPNSSPQRYPCRTVLLLAKAWGWEAET